MRDFIKQILICMILVLIAKILYYLGIKYNFLNSSMYCLGIYMSLIILIFAKALQTIECIIDLLICKILKTVKSNEGEDRE